jgi:hypothetical protein
MRAARSLRFRAGDEHIDHVDEFWKSLHIHDRTVTHDQQVANEQKRKFFLRNKERLDVLRTSMQKGIDLVSLCGNMSLTEEQKEELREWLKTDQVLQNLQTWERLPMMLAVNEAIQKLKLQCDERSQSALQRVATETKGVDNYYPPSLKGFTMKEFPYKMLERSWVGSEDEQDLLRQTNTKKSNKQDRYDNGKEDGFQVGIKVCARYLEGEDYFPGTIVDKRRNGTFDIHYDEGDKEEFVKRSMIVMQEDTRSSAEKTADAVAMAENEERVDRVRREKSQCHKWWEVTGKETTMELKVANLNQIHFMAPEFWKFALYNGASGVMPVNEKANQDQRREELLRMVNAAATKAGVDIFQRPAYQALAFPKKDEYEEATMLSLQDEAEILMEWPTEFMLKYATNKIDQPFEQFMVQLFKDKFTKGPVKDKERVFEKMKEGLKENDVNLWEKMNRYSEEEKRKRKMRLTGCTFEELEAFGRKVWNKSALEGRFAPTPQMKLAIVGCGINDIVRGSVNCEGPDDMLKALHTLQSNPTHGNISFTTKRIRNTHHADAETTVGGYRDVTVTGLLKIVQSEVSSDSMLVEVKLIDSKFIEIKSFMHELDSIAGGNFGVICRGSKSEKEWNSEICTAVVAEGATELGPRAFANCESLFEVALPRSLTAIGPLAFHTCRSLKDITLPDYLERIDYSAFRDCQQLESVNFPAALEVIAEEAFCGCTSLREVSLPESLKCIAKGAFYGCLNLASIRFPVALDAWGEQIDISIEEAAFYGCKALRSITLPRSLKVLQPETFGSCSNLEFIDFNEELMAIGEEAFFKCTCLREIRLPDSLERIDYRAFGSCSNLEIIHFPAWGLKDMSEMAFYGVTPDEFPLKIKGTWRSARLRLAERKEAKMATFTFTDSMTDRFTDVSRRTADFEYGGAHGYGYSRSRRGSGSRRRGEEEEGWGI